MTDTRRPGHVYFPKDYAQSRARFLKLAEAADARLISHIHPSTQGPAGLDLTMDAAILGPDDATRVLAVSSALHGVEGYAGAAIQVALMAEHISHNLPPDTALVLIHGVNPFGFAWNRRVNELNVDVGRNFADPGAPPPENPLYEALHHILVPRYWDITVQGDTRRQLEAIDEHEGTGTVFEAALIGQVSHPDGLGYAGVEPSWSTVMMLEIMEAISEEASHVALLDLHTGLGPHGKATPYALADQLLGDEEALTALFGTQAVMLHEGLHSPLGHGHPLPGIARALAPKHFYGCTLEFGTTKRAAILDALRADAWLFMRGEPLSHHGERITKVLAEAFAPADTIWRDAVVAQGRDAVLRALRGLHAL